jgi:hypothetical protein
MLKRLCTGLRGCYRRWLARIMARRIAPDELRRGNSRPQAPTCPAESLTYLPDAFARHDLGDTAVNIDVCVQVDRRIAVDWALSIASAQQTASAQRPDT